MTGTEPHQSVPSQSDQGIPALRGALDPAIDVIARYTHKELEGQFELLRMPSVPESLDGVVLTKAQRVEKSWKAVADESLVEVAKAVLDHLVISHRQRTVIEDALWALGNHPEIDRRARREIAHALDGQELFTDAAEFKALTERLWGWDQEDLFSRQAGIGPQVEQHLFKNDDWNAEQLFSAVGAYSASDRRFALWLEGLVSGEVLADDELQARTVSLVSPPLERLGLSLEDVGSSGGYPQYQVVPLRGKGHKAPKNIIFGSPHKPDLRFSDLLENTIEFVGDSQPWLVYDRPIDISKGLRWEALQDWWTVWTGFSGTPKAAKKALFNRLQAALPGTSPPQRHFFFAYHEALKEDGTALPALLPEVWLFWDPKTVKQRGPQALLNQRMDFLILPGRNRRIVVEVDGITHYSDGHGNASPQAYARTLEGDRRLRLDGYEVFRFGGYELMTQPAANAVVKSFVNDLLP